MNIFGCFLSLIRIALNLKILTTLSLPLKARIQSSFWNLETDRSTSRYITPFCGSTCMYTCLRSYMSALLCVMFHLQFVCGQDNSSRSTVLSVYVHSLSCMCHIVTPRSDRVARKGTFGWVKCVELMHNFIFVYSHCLCFAYHIERWRDNGIGSGLLWHCPRRQR